MTLKMRQFFISLLLFFTCNLIIPAAAQDQAAGPKFYQSAEEELDQVIAEHLKIFPEETEQRIREGFEKRWSFLDKAFSLSSLHQNVLKQSDDKTTAEIFLDAENAFKKLKQEMQIPEEVKIFFVNDLSNGGCERALYSFINRNVYIGPVFFGDSPSKQIFTLIHELTHCRQHMRKGMSTNPSIGDIVMDEHEADTKAAEAIKCPICMQMIEDCKSNNKALTSDKGYLSKDDIRVHRQSKKVEDVCHAHKKDSAANQQLKTLLLDEEESIKREALDLQIGSMQDRLSTVKYDK